MGAKSSERESSDPRLSAAVEAINRDLRKNPKAEHPTVYERLFNVIVTEGANGKVISGEKLAEVFEGRTQDPLRSVMDRKPRMNRKSRPHGFTLEREPYALRVVWTEDDSTAGEDTEPWTGY